MAQASAGEAAVYWGVVLAVCNLPSVTVLADVPPEWAQIGPAMIPSIAGWTHLRIQARASGAAAQPPAGKLTVVTLEPSAWKATPDLSIVDAGPVLDAARVALSSVASSEPVKHASATWAVEARSALDHAFANVPQPSRDNAIAEIEQQVDEFVQQRGLALVGVELVQEVIARRGRA